jgi:hypothetical protein
VFSRRRWLLPPEDGADSTEICRGKDTVIEYDKLTCTFWKIKI